MAAKKPTPGKTPTKAQRAKMPASELGLPAQGKYPIDTPGRARAALSRAAANATPAQQAQIKAKVKARYPGIGIAGKGKK